MKSGNQTDWIFWVFDNVNQDILLILIPKLSTIPVSIRDISIFIKRGVWQDKPRRKQRLLSFLPNKFDLCLSTQQFAYLLMYSRCIVFSFLITPAGIIFQHSMLGEVKRGWLNHVKGKKIKLRKCQPLICHSTYR